MGRLAERLPAVLREHPQFRLLFVGQALSVIGDRITFVALPFAVIEAVSALCVTAYFTLWETSIQEQIPAHAVSRVGSYDLFVATGLLPFGTAIAGSLSAELGLQQTLIGMSVLGVLAALCVLAVPSVRSLTRPPPAVPL